MTRHAHRNTPAGKPPTSRDFDPSGLRTALGKTFLTALAADFRQHGRRALLRLRRGRRQDYLKLVTAFLPKEFRLKEVELPDMTDEELEANLNAIRAMIAEQKKGQGGEGPAG